MDPIKDVERIHIVRHQRKQREDILSGIRILVRLNIDCHWSTKEKGDRLGQ